MRIYPSKCEPVRDPCPGNIKVLCEISRVRLPEWVELAVEPEKLPVGWQPWGADRRSLLIESLFANIPVSPVVLWWSDPAKMDSLEILDGMQRIYAIRDFYLGRFALEGLDFYPEFNGMRYADLPQTVREKLDCRSLGTRSIGFAKEPPSEAFATSAKEFIRIRYNHE